MTHMPDIESLVEEYERQEKNVTDFNDIRFGEIYLDDKQEEEDYE